MTFGQTIQMQHIVPVCPHQIGFFVVVVLTVHVACYVLCFLIHKNTFNSIQFNLIASNHISTRMHSIVNSVLNCLLFFFLFFALKSINSSPSVTIHENYIYQSSYEGVYLVLRNNHIIIKWNTVTEKELASFEKANDNAVPSRNVFKISCSLLLCMKCIMWRKWERNFIFCKLKMKVVAIKMHFHDSWILN